MKNLIKGVGTTIVLAGATVIGMMAGEVLFNEKLGPWLKRKLNKNDE